MDSCSLLGFGDFLSSAAFSLGGIRYGRLSRIFRLWSPSVFPPYVVCEGRWKFFPSAPSLFVYVFDRSNEEEDPKVCVFTVRVVMSLMVLISSEALISLTSVAYLMMYVNRATHLLYIFKYSGSVSLIHR